MLVSLSDDDARDCTTVDEIASAHLQEIDRKLADLAALRRAIAALVASSGGGVVRQCRVLEALPPTMGARRANSQDGRPLVPVVIRGPAPDAFDRFGRGDVVGGKRVVV